MKETLLEKCSKVIPTVLSSSEKSEIQLAIAKQEYPQIENFIQEAHQTNQRISKTTNQIITEPIIFGISINMTVELKKEIDELFDQVETVLTAITKKLSESDQDWNTFLKFIEEAIKKGVAMDIDNRIDDHDNLSPPRKILFNGAAGIATNKKIKTIYLLKSFMEEFQQFRQISTSLGGSAKNFADKLEFLLEINKIINKNLI
jgi:hypothetical protein